MTAVEWLIKQLNINGTVIPMEIESKAKAMDQEKHRETWDSAHQAGRFEGKGIAEENWQTFESHWEETFKSE